jgi:Holliday junction DNA helicase RuvA
MIWRIKGRLVKKEESCVVVEVGNVYYEINVPSTVYSRLSKEEDIVELVIYHYFSIERNRCLPVMIGFTEELEKDFFEKFIGVSGIGPKAALKAFDKPVSLIAQAIEEGDIDFLKTLTGIGKQKARQIIAHLQGKVGRFALIKPAEQKKEPVKKEIIEEARQILRRLQYNVREIEDMIKRALGAEPRVESVEELLNEIYRQRKVQ